MKDCFWMKIAHWRKYQHYKDRNPPWIKLHNSILMSPTWVMLSDESKLLAIASMLIASRFDGKVPLDETYVKKVTNLERCDFKPLIEFGFFEDASECLQVLANASSKKRRGEAEKRDIGIHEDMNTSFKSRRDLNTRRSWEDWFNGSFWPNYPRKQKRADAFKAMTKVNPDAELQADIMAGLARAKQCRQWQRDDGDYIPLAGTWIRAQQWTDEYEVTSIDGPHEDAKTRQVRELLERRKRDRASAALGEHSGNTYDHEDPSHAKH